MLATKFLLKARMTTKKKTFIGIGAVLAVALFAGVVLTMTTNCGGNSYALTACQEFVITAQVASNSNTNSFVTANKIDDETLYTLSREHWGTTGSDFLIKTNFFVTNSTNREIIIVSTIEFANVPQPAIWNLYRKNPAHAVGYSDGTSGLISPFEFSNLNLNGFASISSLMTNSGFNAFK
jgi:hypothetical protein